MSLKNSFLYCTFLFFLPFALIGQNDINTSPKIKEVGFNATTIFNNFLNFSDDDVVLLPYHFSYKSIKENGQAFRLGAGLRLNVSDGDSFSTDFFSDDLKTTNALIDLRMGYEKQRKITDRWMFYSGFDFILGLDHFKFESEEDDFTSKQRSFRYGFGPVMGIQFMFSERVGLFTESTLYLIRRDTKSETDSSFSSNDDERKSSSNDLSFVLPSNIYFFFRF